MQDSNAEAEEIKQLINEHNNSINSYVVEIDAFFKAYNLNDNDIEIIKHFLIQNTFIALCEMTSNILLIRLIRYGIQQDKQYL